MYSVDVSLIPSFNKVGRVRGLEANIKVKSDLWCSSKELKLGVNSAREEKWEIV